MTGVGRVLVTGATGFIGGHLARAFRAIGAQGAARTLPNDDTSIDWVQMPEAFDHSSLVRLLNSVEVVVHAAGRAHVLRESERDPLATFRSANVETTRALAAAAVEAKVRRFVLLSSVAVYGESNTGTLNAATSTNPSSPYGISRKEAEDALHSVTVDSMVETIVLRLPMVYGPGMKGNPLRLFELVDRVPVLPLGGIENARSMLYVKNLVAAVHGFLSAPVPRDAVLTADGESVSTPDLVREIASELGRRVVLLPVPAALMRSLTALGVTVFGDRFPLTPEAWERLSGSLVIDTTPLQNILGADLPVGRAEALHATAKWYRTVRK